jgi:type 1 glutamine amidotransferase
MKIHSLVPIAASLLPLTALPAMADAPKPLKILLLTGGCCHDYATQKDILKTGIEARINAVVDQIHVPDSNTHPQLPIYGNPDYAKGYDLVIHDECAADIKDEAVVRGVIKPHVDGVPGVNLHCAMHSYRTGDFTKKVETLGTAGSLWFEYLGLQSSGHGAQKPISITFSDGAHPITHGLENWTTDKEELYNNIRLFDNAKPLASGRQENTEFVVAWTNTYGDKKTRVFSTTIGHNNVTVGDARYLDLVSRGILWATSKIDEKGRPLAGYGRTAK